MISSLLSIALINRFSFGVFCALAFLFGSFVFWKKAREEHYDDHEIIDMVLITVFWSLVSARLVYIIFNFHNFGLNILYWLSFWSKPGLHWIGLYAGALIAIINFARNHKLDIFKTLDLAVIGLALAQALVSLGLFLSGAGVGTPTNLPIGIIFPNTFEPRHPVALYGFILWFFLFIFLWWLESKYRRFVWYQKFKGDSMPGFLFFVYLMGLGLFGSLLSLVSQPNLVVYGVNIELAIRISLFLLGSISLLARSGVGTKLGLDHIVWLSKK